MVTLIECDSCKGLKRIDSPRCPHCYARTAGGPGLLARSLAAASLGAAMACGDFFHPVMVEYDIACIPDGEGGCLVCEGEQEPEFNDAGVAHCVAPVRNAGSADGGMRDGGLEDGGEDAGALGDGGSTDAGEDDAGTISDGGPADAGDDDAGALRDGGSTDGGSQDGGEVDAG